MDLQNKTVLVLGDSITEGANASSIENQYVSQLKSVLGAKDVIAYGVGGTTIAKRKTPLGNEYDRDFILRAKEMQEKADCIIVFGGTNDYGHGDVPIGTVGDESLDTFCGSVKYLIDFLKKKYPNALLLFVLPLPRIGQDDPYGEGGRKPERFGTLAEYVGALSAAVKKAGVPALDLFTDKDFALDNPKFTEYISQDGLHPTDAGHKLLAEKIGMFLNGLSN